MRSIHKLLGATALSFSFLAAAPGAVAATQTQLFEFKVGASTTAFGSFSYDDSLLSVNSFAQLSAFNISINVPGTFQQPLVPMMFTFTKAELAALPATVPGGFHFGYDVVNNKFVSTLDASLPGLPYFGGGNAHATMAAFSTTPDTGFFIDWRAPEASATSGIQAMKGGFAGVVNWTGYTITSPVSEPSSILLAAAGLAMIGFMAGKRRRTS